MRQTPGHKFRLKIRGATYNALDFTWRATTDDLIVNGSEASFPGADVPAGVGVANLRRQRRPISRPIERRVGGLQRTELTIVKATWDPDDNPFLTPFSIVQGQFLSVEYIFNRDTPNGRIFWEYVEILDVEMHAEVAGLQPLTIMARTDCDWEDPSSQ